MDLSRSAPLVAGAICFVSFGLGLVVLRYGQEPEPEQPTSALVLTGGDTPTDAPPKPDSPPVQPSTTDPATGVAGLITASATNAPADAGTKMGVGPWSGLNGEGWKGGAVNGPWKERSGYGIANPRRLTPGEKKALNLLGGIQQVQSSKFTRTTLKDGSEIPGVPPMPMEEVKKKLFDKVAAKGLGEGFESFMREIAIQNPDHMTLRVKTEADWDAVEASLEFPRKLYGPQQAFGFRLTWYGIGTDDQGNWLSFGVDSGKVRMVRASFPGMYVSDGLTPVEEGALIPAELVPGGRSDPNPDKAWKAPKSRPKEAGPREVEVLQKLGVVKDVQFTYFEGNVFANKIDDPAKAFEEAIGKPLSPDMLTTARTLARSKVSHLIVTPSKSISLDTMTDIMNDTTMRKDDTTTFPGLKVRWYRYNWIEFGIVDGQVKKVRITVNGIPAKL
jgi:hypothetical protein